MQDDVVYRAGSFKKLVDFERQTDLRDKALRSVLNGTFMLNGVILLYIV